MPSTDQGTSELFFTMIKIGAILIMLDAAFRFVLFVLIGSIAFSSGFVTGLGIYLSWSLALVLIVALFLLVLSIVFGYLVLYQARQLKENPNETVHFVYLLVLALLAFIVCGGFIVGSLMIIVSIVLIMPSGTSFSINFSPLVGKRICPTCGLISRGNANYFSSWGKKFQ